VTVETKERIREVMSRYLHAEELQAIFRGAPILTTLTIDSLSLLNLVVELESRFKVSFDYDTIETSFATIDSLAAFLDSESGKQEK